MSLPYAPPSPRRRPMRLREYDYGRPGAYFVTICAHEKKPVLDDASGGIVLAAWQALPSRFPGVGLDQFVVMPNHVHGIVVINDEAARASAKSDRVTERGVGEAHKEAEIIRKRGMAAERGVGEAHEPPLPAAPESVLLRVERSRMLLPQVVGFFKMNSAKRINLLRGTPGVPVWQRGYYEHVVRSEAELERIRQYIQDNPLGWVDDPENPESKTHKTRGGDS